MDETEAKLLGNLLRTVRIGIVCCALIYLGVSIEPSQLMGVI